QRMADRAHARAAGALLPPRLLAAALHVRAVLRLMRAAPLRRVGVDDRLPYQILVHASAEHIVADVDAADFRVLVGDDINLHGIRSAKAFALLLALLGFLDLRDLDLLRRDRLADDHVAGRRAGDAALDDQQVIV